MPCVIGHSIATIAIPMLLRAKCPNELRAPSSNRIKAIAKMLYCAMKSRICFAEGFQSACSPGSMSNDLSSHVAKYSSAALGPKTCKSRTKLLYLLQPSWHGQATRSPFPPLRCVSTHTGIPRISGGILISPAKSFRHPQTQTPNRQRP